MLFSRVALLLVCGLVWPASAHEFWIEPDAYRVDPGEKVVAHFRNGERFKGNRLAFIPSQYPKHDVIIGNSQHAISSGLGQRPAIDEALDGEGLGIVAVTSSVARIRYKTWEKFQAFIDHKDFDLTQDAHLAKGYPPTEFRERYRRFAKALVGVGHARGDDRRVGLEIELVALANPYTDALETGLPVQAYLQGEPRADVQVELFEKSADGEVVVSLHRTDADGIAVLPVVAGHSYLVDTVHLRPAPAGSEADVVWDTLWASLTFAVD